MKTTTKCDALFCYCGASCNTQHDAHVRAHEMNKLDSIELVLPSPKGKRR